MSGPKKARRTQHFPDPRLEHQIDELVRAINAAVDVLEQIGVDIDLRISQHAADTSLHITRDYRDAMDNSLVHPSATNPFVTEESLNDAMTGSAKPGVQTLEDLAAIPPDQRADKDTRLVEDEGKIYRFDADADHGDVKPLEGPGWWIAVAAATQNHNNLSNLQGGSATERYHLTKAERDSLVAHLADTNNPHQVTPEQIGAETPTGSQAKAEAAAGAALSAAKAYTDEAVAAHAGRTDNPHQVTPEQIGAETPSGAQAKAEAAASAALSGAQAYADQAVAAHAGRTDNPHNVQAQQVPYSSGVVGFSPADVKAALDALAGVRIVEMGSNSNGEYVRWENGLQVCFKQRVGQGPSRVDWVLPAAFVNATYAVVGTSYDWPFLVVTVSWNNTTANKVHFLKYIHDGTEFTGDYRSISAIAIGRWK